LAALAFCGRIDMLGIRLASGTGENLQLCTDLYIDHLDLVSLYGSLHPSCMLAGALDSGLW